MRRADRFSFTPELAARLRAFRKRAGLSQQNLAEMMGITCRGGHHVVSQLELGKVANPTIGMIADYLRACRAAFRDIADILDKYTARPAVTEIVARLEVQKALEQMPEPVRQQTENYDRKLSALMTGRNQLTTKPGVRAEQARKYATAELRRRRLHRLVVDTIKQRKLRPGGSVPEKLIQNSVLELWKRLGKKRGHPDEYQQVMDKVLVKLLSNDSVPARTGRVVLAEVVELFRQAQQSGQLDALPGDGGLS